MATHSGAIHASLQSTCTKESGREAKEKHFFGDLNLESRGGEQALRNGRQPRDLWELQGQRAPWGQQARLPATSSNGSQHILGLPYYTLHISGP